MTTIPSRQAGERKLADAAQVVIRRATAEDLREIMTIERLSFSQPWSRESFFRELSLPFSTVTVAQETTKGAILGFLCRWLVVDEAHILNVAVHPRARRRGIGRLLMEASMAEARKQGVRVITLEVRQRNLAARSLYRQLGFRECFLRRGYYGPGEDAIVMELRLCDPDRSGSRAP